MLKKILIMGLPGSGKTTLAVPLSQKLGAVHFNGDSVRENLNKDLGFSLEDRIEQARRMGYLCDVVNKSGHIAIADFVCPTPETRKAFGQATIIWIDRISESRFSDTNNIFIPPKKFDIRLKDGSCADWLEEITRFLL